MKIDHIWRRLTDLWWDRLPKRVSKIPWVSPVMNDGYYLTKWPPASALVGPVAGLIGLVVALLIRFHPVLLMAGISNSPAVSGIYSQYLWFVLIIAILGILSNHVGLWLCIGYIVPDFLFHLVDPGLGLPRLYADMMFVVLCLSLGPRSQQFGTWFFEFFPKSFQKKVNKQWITAACTFLLTCFWGLSFSTLARPVYAWIPAGIAPTQVIRPVSGGFFIIGIVVAAAVFLRQFLEAKSDRQSTASIAETPSWLKKILRFIPEGTWQAAALQSVCITVLLAGLMTTWVDGLIFAVLMTALSAVNSGLLSSPRLPSALMKWLAAMSVLQRLAILVIAGIPVIWLILWVLLHWLPMLRVQLIAIALFFIVFHLLKEMLIEQVKPEAAGEIQVH